MVIPYTFLSVGLYGRVCLLTPGSSQVLDLGIFPDLLELGSPRNSEARINNLAITVKDKIREANASFELIMVVPKLPREARNKLLQDKLELNGCTIREVFLRSVLAREYLETSQGEKPKQVWLLDASVSGLSLLSLEEDQEIEVSLDDEVSLDNQVGAVVKAFLKDTRIHLRQLESGTPEKITTWLNNVLTGDLSFNQDSLRWVVLNDNPIVIHRSSLRDELEPILRKIITAIQNACKKAGIQGDNIALLVPDAIWRWLQNPQYCNERLIGMRVLSVTEHEFERASHQWLAKNPAKENEIGSVISAPPTPGGTEGKNQSSESDPHSHRTRSWQSSFAFAALWTVMVLNSAGLLWFLVFASHNRAGSYQGDNQDNSLSKKLAENSEKIAEIEQLVHNLTVDFKKKTDDTTSTLEPLQTEVASLQSKTDELQAELGALKSDGTLEQNIIKRIGTLGLKAKSLSTARRNYAAS